MSRKASTTQPLLKYTFRTKQEALKKKNDALRELEKGMLANDPQQKLGDYLHLALALFVGVTFQGMCVILLILLVW